MGSRPLVEILYEEAREYEDTFEGELFARAADQLIERDEIIGRINTMLESNHWELPYELMAALRQLCEILPTPQESSDG